MICAVLATAHRMPDLNLYVGIGTAAEETTSLKDSYQQARRAIRYLQTCKTGRSVAMYEEMGLSQVLFEIKDEEVLRRFCTAMIGPIIQFDEHNHQVLFETLCAYYDSDFSPQCAAEKLHVHKNTVMYPPVAYRRTVAVQSEGVSADRIYRIRPGSTEASFFT